MCPLPSRTDFPPQALSPLDGRYREQLEPLALIFSEQSLMLHRIRVELSWLLQLADTSDSHFEPLILRRGELSDFASRIATLIAQRSEHRDEICTIHTEIKELERTTRHDVKAVEYWLGRRFSSLGLKACIPFVHFACTSEDINSAAWGSMLHLALTDVLRPQLSELIADLCQLADAGAEVAMLARTHGQSASPTTFGKEVAVYIKRLREQAEVLSKLKPRAKFSGATGNYSAHSVALPDLQWPSVCRRTVESLELEYNGCTTQIECGDRLAEICHCLMRINRILTDLARDFWGYISLGYLRQKKVAGEVGSSTMPHKINPIDFENAEGNMAIAHAMLERLAADLPVSRWQRDLSGSTLQRNLGAALGHSQLAWQSILRGLGRIEMDRQAMREDLLQNWQVLAEAVQTAMRLTGKAEAYENMQAKAAAGELDADRFAAILCGLELPAADRERLEQLTPADYTGLAKWLAQKYGTVR